jgi:hypothetical protein
MSMVDPQSAREGKCGVEVEPDVKGRGRGVQMMVAL